MNPKIAKIKHINFNKNQPNSFESQTKGNNHSLDYDHLLPSNYEPPKNLENYQDEYELNLDSEFENSKNNQFDSNNPLFEKENPKINPNFRKDLKNNEYPSDFGSNWQTNFDERMGETEQNIKGISSRVANIQDGQDRVLRKSVIFLVASVVSFGFLTLAGINLFSLSSNLILSFILGILSLIVYIICTNIFFIILADKLYFWVNLGCHFLVLIFLHSLIGQLNLLTLIVAFAVVIFVFFAYTDLEKTQLGSRLFTISNITSESTRVLLTLATIILCLGVFNSIISQGTVGGKFTSSENYFGQNFLENDFIVDNILIGKQASAPNSEGQNVGRNFGLNTAFMGRSPNVLSVSGGNLKKQIEGELKNATFADFLANNYRPAEVIMTPTEIQDQEAKCTKEKITSCDEQIEKTKLEKLSIWKKEAYPKINFELEAELDTPKFRQIVRVYYRNFIKGLGAETKDISNQSNSQIVPFLPSLSANLLVPSIFTFLIYILMMILRPLISFSTTIGTWVIWNLLKKTGFVHIEIENVQAETVSI